MEAFADGVVRDLVQMVLYGLGVNAVGYLWGYFVGASFRWIEHSIKD